MKFTFLNKKKTLFGGEPYERGHSVKFPLSNVFIEFLKFVCLFTGLNKLHSPSMRCTATNNLIQPFVATEISNFVDIQ